MRTEQRGGLLELTAVAPGIELGVHPAPDAVGEAVVLAGAADADQRVARGVVAGPVAAVIGRPELTRHRVMRHADAVAHAARLDPPAAAVGVEGDQRREDVAIEVADVAVDADVRIDPAVGAKRGELPVMVAAMVPFGRQGIGRGQFLRRRHVVEVRLDVREAQHAVDGEDIEIVPHHHDAVRLRQALRDHARAGGAVRVAADGIDAADRPGAGEDRAIRTFCHGAHAGHAMGIDLGREAGRQADGANRHLIGWRDRHARGMRGEGGALRPAHCPARNGRGGLLLSKGGEGCQRGEHAGRHDPAIHWCVSLPFRLLVVAPAAVSMFPEGRGGNLTDDYNLLGFAFCVAFC